MHHRKELLAKAKSGDPLAQYNLACDYEFEKPKDERRARYWYRMAAQQGNTDAQNALAEFLRDGAGGHLSRREAVHWFRLAAAGGNADAQVNLGFALFYGKGVRRNRAEALKWYRKAARQDHSSAQLNLGHMYRNGDVVTRNLDRAMDWYRKAGQNGNANGYYWLARTFEEFESNSTFQLLARFYFFIAATEGHMLGQRDAGIAMIVGPGPKNYMLAAHYFRMAIAQGDDRSCYHLGLCYRDGTGVRKNKRWARHWLTRAAGVNDKDAIRELERL